MNVWDVCVDVVVPPWVPVEVRQRGQRAERIMILLIMEEWNLVNEAGYAQCCRLFLCTQCHIDTHTHTHLTALEVYSMCKIFTSLWACIYIYMSVSVCEYLSVCVKAWPLMIHQLIKHRHHKRCLFHTNRRQFYSGEITLMATQMAKLMSYSGFCC